MIGAHGDSRRRPEQFRPYAGLLVQLPTGRLSWRLSGIDPAAGRYPSAPAVPHQQDMRQGPVEYPGLGGQWTITYRFRAKQPIQRMVVLNKSLACIIDRSVKGALLYQMVGHLAEGTSTH